MDICLEVATFDELRPLVSAHLNSLPSPVDSFVEEHIIASKLYQILFNGQPGGYAGIYNEQVVTQFVLDEPYRQHGQPAFTALKGMERVNSAFVPTCDGFYLAHALDEHREVPRQAYIWCLPSVVTREPPPPEFTLSQATVDDAPLIRRSLGDFLDHLDERIGRDEVFFSHRGQTLVGFGFREKSHFYENTASIGMFTLPDHRTGGVGTATLQHLIALNESKGIRSVAGCWYYNHPSKRTLQRAGLYSGTRLLRIEF